MTRPVVLLLVAPCVLGALFVPRPGRAGDEAPPVRLGLADTIARAQAASPRLAQLRALRDAGDAALRGARAERRPFVDLAASYTRYSDVPELTAPFPPPQGPVTIFPNIPNSYASRLGVTQPLYTGGRLSAQVRAAEAERDAAARDVDAGSADLVLETSAAYWDLATAIESERVLREAVASYEAHLKDGANRERLGLAAHSEVLAVQVERDRAELSRLRAANDAEVIEADLARLLDLPPGTRVDPSDPLDGGAPQDEDPAALVDKALAARPEHAAQRSRVAAAEARETAARADRRPQLRLGGGYDYANPNRRILPPTATWQDSWDASLSLTFRVFESGRTAAAVAQRAAQADASRKGLEDLERRIRYEVTERTLDEKTAAAAVQVAARNVEAAAESRRVSAERYKAGVIPSSELLDAEVALLRAGLDRAEAQARLRMARASLDRAVGR